MLPPEIIDLKEALAQPLPGWQAHQQMVPPHGREEIHNIPVSPNHRRGGVLALLYPNRAQVLHLVLIKRPTYNGVHSGQIALPGGAWEAGETVRQTALREAQEEVGVAPEQVTVLGSLTPLYIPPSNFMVYPLVGYTSQYPAFKPDEREVDKIIEVPLAMLLDEETCCTTLLNHSSLGLTPGPCFNVFGHKVWGATAMILSELITIIRIRNCELQSNNL